MRWWTKCVSMVIAKIASRNVAFKAGGMIKAVLDAQASFVIVTLLLHDLLASMYMASNS